MQKCMRCERSFSESADSAEILIHWYRHLRDVHGDNIGAEYLARVDSEGDICEVVYAGDITSIMRLLSGDLARARKVWGK